MDGWVVGWWMYGWMGGWMVGWVDDGMDGILGAQRGDVPQGCKRGCPSEVGSLYADVRSTRPGIWGWVLPQSLIIYAGPGVCPLWSMTQSENGRVLVKKLLQKF